MTTIGSMDPASYMSILDPTGALGQDAVRNFLGKTQTDPNLMNRTIERAQNNEVKLTAGSFERIKGKGPTQAAGSVTWAAPPSQQYSQARDKVGNFTAQPIEKAGKIHIVSEDGKKAMGLKPEEFKQWVDERMNCGNPRIAADTQKFLDANGIVKTASGSYMVPVQPNQAALQAAFPGNTMQNPVSSGVLGTLQNNSWLLPTMGFASGGIGGLVMGLIGAKALKSTANSMTSGGALAPGLLGAGGAGTVNYLGGSSFTGGLGTTATAMGLLTGGGDFAEGLAFQMKTQMRTMAEDAKMNSLISMCNNPGIPIEDLIAMFMAQMSDTYDIKLREKMEETARAEKIENDVAQMKRDGDYQAGLVKGNASMIGGMLSMVPGVGMLAGAGVAMAGQTAAAGMQAMTDAKIAMKEAALGKTKSSTILMQEIQILMNKWKQVTELLSNLSKTIHDMAMTPIRNLR
jgi:hypothetical protein